jgi:hypothetical protein
MYAVRWAGDASCRASGLAIVTAGRLAEAADHVGKALATGPRRLTVVMRRRAVDNSAKLHDHGVLKHVLRVHRRSRQASRIRSMSERTASRAWTRGVPDINSSS